MRKTVYKEVDIDVDLEDFETDDLIDELEFRGELPTTSGIYDSKELLEQIWMLRRKSKDYQTELDQLIYQVTGHVV